MQTRIVHTKVWKDEWFVSLSPQSKILWLYLLTNEHVNIVGVFELSDRVMIFDTGLSNKELQAAKSEITGKAFFYNGYVRLLNVNRYNSYSGQKLDEARKKQIGQIPLEISEHLMGIDTSINTSIHTTDNHNHKHNHKPEIKKEEKEEKGKSVSELQQVVDYYNKTFGKEIRSVAAFEKNFSYWHKIHSIEKITQAIASARRDSFWKYKLTLTILFRIKNPRGEDVDYIEDLSNRNVIQIKKSAPAVQFETPPKQVRTPEQQKKIDEMRENLAKKFGWKAKPEGSTTPTQQERVEQIIGIKTT